MKTITVAIIAASALLPVTLFANISHPHSIHHPHHSKIKMVHTQSAKININSATAAQLGELKGLGPKKAQAIVDDREKNGSFKSINDLTRVKGIGDKMLARLSKQNPDRLSIQ